MPFLRIDQRSAVLGKGEKTLSFEFTAANELSYYGSGQIQEDYELDRFLVRARKGLGKGWDATFDVPLMSRGGGFLDPVVKFWHDSVLAGLNPYRTTAPFGRSYIVLPYGRAGSATGVGDLSVWLTKRLRGRSMVTFAVKAPTGNAQQMLGSGGVDGAISFQTQAPVVRRVTAHAQLGAVAQSPSSFLRHTRGLVHQAAFALAYQRNSRDNFVVQLQSEDSATVTGNAESDSGHRIFSVGYQRRLNDKSMFQFYFSENQDWPNWPIPRLANQGPDFTAGIKLTRKF